MDVHREFAQLAVVEDGLVRDEGRIGVTPEALRAWAGGLRGDDEVALEATGNSDAIANLLPPLVERVVVSNPSKTRAIAEAKVKTDKVDARILAQLLAADFLPPVWLPDERTRSLRRQVTRRAHLVRQRTRIKNQVHAILTRNLAPRPLRAFYQRVDARRGFQKAIVATARKMTVLAWHLVTKDQDYAFARPGLVTHKRRKLQLAAGAPSRRGNYRVPGAAYNNKQRRAEETAQAERAEHAYQILVAHWQPKPAHRPART